MRSTTPSDSDVTAAPRHQRHGRMRVMQLVLSLSPGGTERLVIEIVRGLRAHQVDSVVCCLDTEGAWAREVAEMGVPVITLQRGTGFTPSLARSIAKLVSDCAIDVIHCHHYSPFVYGQLAGLLRPGVRVVFTEHGRLSDAPPSRKRRLVNPLLGRLPAAIYAVSEDLRRHMIAEGFAAQRVEVLHNGIEPGAPATADGRHRARAALGLAPGALVVGTVARLDPVKDLPTLVRAFAALHVAHRHARLVVVGDGPERGRLDDLVGELGLRSSVVLAGHRQDVRALLPAFDIFANSSIHEGVSLTILEAMAAGIPVVATNVGGNPEVVLHDTGILVPGRSEDALASALAMLAADADRRRAMGTAARARVESSFSAQRMVAAYAASYRPGPRVGGGRVPARARP
jgi:glycosyltransferase involved in cell wall biosynthesis